MIESLQYLATGFGIATTAQNLFYCLMGAIVGTLIGVLPGLGPIAGIAFRLKSVYDVLNEISDEIREIRVSGGFTQSFFWPQIVANVLNRKLLVPSWTETSNLGAAIWAMLGAGVIDSWEEAASFNSVEHVCKPKEEDNQTYELIFRIYKSLYLAVSPLFEETAALQQRVSNK